MRDNNSIAVIDKKTVDNAKDILKGVTEQHTKVSSIKTPKAYVYKKMGFDYVKLNYMRAIADKHFPGWSWTIQKTAVLGSEAYVVHGRLKWFDNGVWREGDATAAHRVQKKRGTNDYVDLGNDIKAANTDCIKKAFNMYMNICDDVYRNQVEDPELTDKQKNNILESAKISGRDTEIMEKIESGIINAFNYKASMAKLERLAQ